MWPFRRRPTLEESGFFQGFTDWHSHILPGVDDGVQTLEESLRVLEEYERLGVREVWLTPHIMEDIPNTTAHLRQRFEELQAAYSQGVPGNPAVETHSCVSANKTTSHPLASSNVVETHSCVSSEETAASPKLTLHLAAENMSARMLTTCWWKPAISVLPWACVIFSSGYRPKVTTLSWPIPNAIST